MYYVFRGEDLEAVHRNMQYANSLYWIVGVGFVIIFIVCEAWILDYLLKIFGQKIKFTHCCMYSFVGFFVSCITPSASGGQPAQMVFMKKDNIPLHESTIVLMMVTITYKAVLVLYGLLLVIIRPTSIMNFLGDAVFWVYLGIFLNVVVVGAMILLTVKPMIMRHIVVFIFSALHKITNSDRLEKLKFRVERAMEAYVEKAEFMITHKLTMLKIFVITFVQRTILFAITFLVFLSFGIKGAGLVDVTALQGLISVAVDMLPLPGGMGISEHLFLIIFEPMVGSDMTIPIMIVSRGISYYTQLVMSALVSAIAYINFFGRRRNRAL